MFPLRSSLLRRKGKATIDSIYCSPKIPLRGYAQATFGSPLDGSRPVLTPPPETSKSPAARRVANGQPAPVRKIGIDVGNFRLPKRVLGRISRRQQQQTEGHPNPIPPVTLGRATGGLRVGDKDLHPVLVRDACTCSQCVDPSSTQKNFQTSDIPSKIKIKSLETLEGGEIRIRWNSDVPGFGEEHVTAFTEEGLQFSGSNSVIRDRTRESRPLVWDVAKIKKKLEFVSFDDYMTSDKGLWRALWLLQTQGLMIVRNVPESEKSVEDIALRIGNIRDSLYGRTWDVKSVPDAKNVAYTDKHLGLHMDLLYMGTPPGFQFLHCLKSTAQGGASLFADAFNAAERLNPGQRAFLAHTQVAYQYKNAGEYYYHTHPIIELNHPIISASPQKFRCINYSPPFQANYLLPHTRNATETEGFLNALRAFTEQTEHVKNVLEYRLQEGECVIFNNRRILHGRKQFDALGGERWLKGTYIDTDVLQSRYRVLNKKFHPEVQTTGDPNAQHVFEQEVSNEPALKRALGEA